MNDHVEVLVVGAGPTGLTLACDLQRRGVRFRVISAADHGFEGSRAKGLQPRTLEVFDDLGVLPDLQPRGALYPLLGLHVGPLTLPWVMYKRYKPTEAVPHANTLLVPQNETDASVRRRLEELGGAVEYSTRLVSYEQDLDGLVATVEGPAGTDRIRARFLVGADGGGSIVRLNAGIDFVGTTDETDRMIVADVTLGGLSRKRWHVWPRNGGRFMALCPLPGSDKFQLMLKLRPDENADLKRDAVNRLVQEFVGRAKLRVEEIHWASVWRPNIRLAARYRRGNVFLAGDAAHVHPPTGAQGLNTGVQDAYNLGWKLAQVLAGAPDALLDTYEAERQPVAARVLGLSSEIYAGISNQPLAATKRGDEERQLTLTYRTSGQSPDGAEPREAVRVGDRAPDARFTDSQGRPGRLFDVFRGPHFTLIAVGDRAIDGLARINWPDRGAPLRTVALAADAAHGLRRIYGIQEPAHILVRPDGYVASVVHDNWIAAFDKHAQLMLPPLAS
ncbi:FAD-dependent monooxygenase [Frankia sp. CNm7]|uniref:FAD-dependent monooxygenase n=1 Tax=Frankia nepalensis TaxID=1836974 RepID=A0A937RR41_9ACTN|nr:FAD-dependent monooxygenase [Frankia nepalensis]MBL7501977.1 FAD-dependent monooxygenase [Frankia nepalensis]MBL7510607.1 FAD-dependent monooxygenase [Frankia nepalensis]MBL7517347.1 FAD-dependent monooxygenase [Frankia nepalensis]MBL7633430.1 FAD-dependent monooxygenase [Frankia nepalensis]